jgi:hypothetical protein
VQPGDTASIVCEVRPSDSGLCPDYRVHGELRHGGSVTPFDYRADHHGTAFRAQAFYERLFPV